MDTISESLNTLTPSAGADRARSLLEQAWALDQDSLQSDALSQLFGWLGLAPLRQAKGNPSLAGSWRLTIQRSREFGMVVSVGMGEAIGGGHAFRAGETEVSVAAALADGYDLLALFKRSYAYAQLKGAVCDDRLRHCFSAAIELARSCAAAEAKVQIEQLVVGPVVAMDGLLLPLAGRCQLAAPKASLSVRPLEKIDKLLHPESIGIIGVSATNMNFGRIILKNLLASGYDPQKMTIIRAGETQIDGVTCVESLAALPHKLDLFIVSVAAEGVYPLVDELIAQDAAASVMLVPGGLGETEASRDSARAMQHRIQAAHASDHGGPLFLGGNCLGVVSHPGGYDSWFIPRERLPKPQKKQPRHAALISQSGAFMITRLSKNPWLDPAYMTALGNQIDISHGDMLSYYVDRDEIDTIGVYIEGFNELDGLRFADAVKRAVARGKQVVVYKAGRTESGKASALGHTASIAGDYPLCETLLTQAGALVARDFTEFDDLFYIASCLHDKVIGGNRVAGVSGAGFETVGMADSIAELGFSLEVAPIQPETAVRLTEVLAAKRLDALMEVRNPIDINPGADDEAHVECTRAFAEADNVDAVVVGLDPLSPMMRTLASCSRPGFDLDHPDSVAQLLPPLVAAQSKPIIGIVDGGPLYDPMAERLMDQGVCVFRSCERGMAALARYISARLRKPC